MHKVEVAKSKYLEKFKKTFKIHIKKSSHLIIVRLYFNDDSHTVFFKFLTVKDYGCQLNKIIKMNLPLALQHPVFSPMGIPQIPSL